ncbi:hypothetical protein GCM10011581_26530 [Saccharopolyspora subtropica]|uniref:NB-ARC domain-containing protein n=2 Tax=Saccharopolyspora thermophila TaxID=89367 RepID=A0A917JW87_9PSEU|nr:hypothetical protein GCM10011581_26530 [Saccharopolyspora subtropica]
MDDRLGDRVPGAAAWNVASGSAQNVVQAGVVEGGVHFHSAGHAPVKLPYWSGSFPPLADKIQERDVTKALTGVLDSGDTVVLSSDSVVVSGMGGVGKTQVARYYAERVWKSGAADLVAWVTATSREAIISGYARLATELTGIEDPEPELGAQRLLAWLASTSVRWLIVLDDLQRPDDLRDLWPPNTSTGQIVVTTRRRDSALRGHDRRMIDVGVFTPDEANAYLRAKLADEPSLLEGASELAEELGYLPLALAQVSAYMQDRALSCAEYQRRLTSRRHQLASLLPEPQSLPDQHHATVAATWSLSVELANELRPAGLAQPLLEVASLLDANGIPRLVFATEAIANLLTTTVGREIDTDQASDGLGCLHRLSLITLDPSSVSQEVRIHALVQRATRENFTHQQHELTARAAADALRT